MDFKSKTFRLWLVLSLCWLVLYTALCWMWLVLDDHPDIYVVVFLMLFNVDPAPVVAGYILGPPIIIILLIFAVERLKGWLRIAIISSGVWLIGWFTIGRMIYLYAMGIADAARDIADGADHLAAVAILGVTVVAVPWIVGALIFVVSKWIKQGV